MSEQPLFSRSRAKARDKLGRLFHLGRSTANVTLASANTNSPPPPRPQTGSNLQRIQSSPPSPSALTIQPLLTASPAHQTSASSNSSSGTVVDRPGNKETTTRKEDRIGPALDVLSQVLKAATAATAVFPPAQSVIGGIASAVNIVKDKHQNKVDRREVKKNLEEAGKRLDLCKGVGKLSDEMSERILKLESELRADIGSIDEATKESWWRKWTEGNAQELDKHYGKLSSMLNVFITETVIGVDGRVEALSRITEELRSIAKQNSEAISQLRADEKFKQLDQATNIAYDAGPLDLRRGCTPDTRKQILADLMTWATDDTNAQVYWLSGMAGTGKTTIAYSFCELLQKAGLLCTSFFCSRAVMTSTNPRDVLPSIAFHLASYSQPFAKSLFDALREHDNVNIQQKELEKQLDALILRPAEKASLKSGMLKHCVVVYDGTDEAANVKEAGKLIALFLKNAENLPFKIFISSRRDDVIKSEFEHTSSAAHSVLHDVEESLVEADIRLYIHERLNRVPGLVSEEDIDTLVERSGKLFVYAAVLCSFMDVGKKGEGKARLRAIMDSSPKSIPGTKKRPYDALDQIYKEILFVAEQDSPEIWTVLLVILTAQNPLTVCSITNILDFEEFQVSNVVTSLHAVLSGSDSEDHPVTIFHTSFRDFLIDKSRGGTYCDLISEPHKTLTFRCLEIMKEQLVKDNICMIKSKEIRKTEIETSKIRDSISVALEYSCTSWIHHVMEVTEGQWALCEKDVMQCFDVLILRWIECMAWLGLLEYAVKSLRRVETSQQSTSELCFAAMDSRRCILQCFEVIRDFPLEVYHSALVWLPERTRISRRFQWQDWKVTCGNSKAWDACESTLIGHSNSVKSVCFLHDGKRVVSASLDKTIRIWNVETGEEEKRLEGHSGSVMSVAVFHDGTRIVSGSSDTTVRIWNVRTGKEEMTMEGHLRTVCSVAVFHDGKRVVSGAEDNTVRIWNVETGKEERRLEGHLDFVRSVAISHDGRRVVSGSDDKTARIWNVETGEEERRIKGYSDSMRSVVISQDGTRVVTGSNENALRVWSVETGKEERKIEGHSDWVRSVAISRDGKRVISGSMDNTVRIWNLETGEERQMEGHSDWVQSVAISPDGRRVVSGSNDSMVRIWNVKTDKEEEKVEKHSDWVLSVAISHDGSKVVSGSADKNVRIWNVETGREERKLEGHTGSVESVAISHDGRRVVSGSNDNTVRIWNVVTGKEERIFKGHLTWVRSVAISHDGKRAVSKSDDGTMRIWNVETGKEERKLDVHSENLKRVHFMAFSCDGRRVAFEFSGSDTVQIWTVETDEVEKMTCSAFVNHPEFELKSNPSDCSITYESGWLYSTSISPRLWLLPHFQNFEVSTVSGQIICFGYQNGEVVVVQCTKAAQ